MPAARQACTFASLKAGIGQQRFDLAQRRRQRRQLVQHRLDLLLVGGRLHAVVGDHQQATRDHASLRIVGYRQPSRIRNVI